MLNTSQVYNLATKPKEKIEEEEAAKAKAAEDSLFAAGVNQQTYDTWLNSPITKKLFEELNKAKAEKFLHSITCSMSNDQFKSNQALTQVDTIERILNYVRNKTPIY